MALRPLAFTLVTLVSFAALPVIAQDTDDAAEQDAIEDVTEDVLAADDDTPTVATDLPVTLPDPDAVPPADAAPRLDTPEAVFIADALRDGEMEIAAAELAQDRSENGEVRLLAERIQDDHATINERLGALRDAGAATEPRGRPAHPEMDRLQGLEGEAFDAAWLAVQEKHHRAAIDKFERAAASPALDVPVKSAAAEALTTLRAHADAIRDLQDSLGFE
jgi:predicted outer membrane protein